MSELQPSPTATHVSFVDWRSRWSLDPEVTYLNHGSFGPSPRCVQQAAEDWTARLERQPMQFFMRDMETALEQALQPLARLLDTSPSALVFVDNATMAMNIVAASARLAPGDEVLLTDHEYGAVARIWRRACQRAGAKVITAALPCPLTSDDDVIEAVFQAVTDRTRMLVVSHVTSPTAVILPVPGLCARARRHGLTVCVDGPHAVNMVPLSLRQLDCDFYTGSLHKWLCAPFGSGFLYVHPRCRKHLQPAIVSWGGSLSGQQPGWKDEYVWLGTRNPAAVLAVPSAIEFFEQRVDVLSDGLPSSGLSNNSEGPADATSGESSRESVTVTDLFQRHAKSLLDRAERAITALTGLPPLCDDTRRWTGTMRAFPLPPADSVPFPVQRDPLQDRLFEQHRIEVPIIHWNDHRLLRVSAHLYNSADDIDRLIDALRTSL